jgi:protein-S-isoprenylcysteine O-methyltransferase Ste14
MDVDGVESVAAQSKQRPLWLELSGWVALVLAALLVRPWLRKWLPHSPPMSWPVLASLIPWIVFELYWGIAAKDATKALQSESSSSRSIHTILVNTGLLLILVPATGLRTRLLPLSVWVWLAGLAIETCGLLFAIWSRRCLGKHWSGRITIKEDHELVRVGPYRTIRHPIYTGILGIFAGTAVVIGELHALLGLSVAVFAYLRKIRLEEANLQSAFGTTYADYRAESWSLIPGIF